MATITIPGKIAKGEDLVAIPRKEYEFLITLKKTREFRATEGQKRALVRAERNLSNNKTLSYNELVKKLGFGD